MVGTSPARAVAPAADAASVTPGPAAPHRPSSNLVPGGVASSNAVVAGERVPKLLYGGVPYLLLAGSTGLAAGIDPDAAPGGLPVTLALAALTAAWLLWPILTALPWPARRWLVITFYCGLLVLIAALITRSPSYTLFGALGYGYALTLLPPRLISWGVAVTAVLTVIAQGPTMPAPLLAVNICVPLLFVGWYVGRQSERRNEMVTDLARTNAHLQTALAENTELHGRLVAQAHRTGVVEERRRLAQEIHDTVAQDLVAVIAQLQAADRHVDGAGGWRRHVHSATELARASLTQARRSVRALRPEVLDRARLPEALAHLTTSWTAMGPTAAEFTTTGTPTPLHPDIEVALLRVAQEALTNVTKYADATRVALTLSYFADVVALDIRDDGRGFDPATVTSDAEGGFGLPGMRQRLSAVGGTLDIESEPGGGVAVAARAPAIGPDPTAGAEPTTDREGLA